MSDAAKRRADYRDVLAAPRHVVVEVVDGELYTSPRPAALHANAASNLEGELYGPFRRGRGGPGGWILLVEPELHFEGDIVVPDLAGWRRERMPELADVAFFELAPDWVCEVLSPSTAKVDRQAKLPLYARQGVPHLWLINASEQSLTLFRLGGDGYILIASFVGDERCRPEPFDAVELELGALWAR